LRYTCDFLRNIIFKFRYLMMFVGPCIIVITEE